MDGLSHVKKMDYFEQRYCCCALLAAINAKIYLSGLPVSEEEFEELADLVCCRTGAAIGVEKSYPFLGLEFEDGTNDLDWVETHLPVQIAYFDERFGFHSALVVGRAGAEVNLVNSNKPRLRWVEIEFPKWKHQQLFRSFSLL